MSDKVYYNTIRTINYFLDALNAVPFIGFKVHEEGEIPDEPLILAINHKLKVLVNPFLRDKDKRTRWADHFFIAAKYPKKVHFMVQDSQFMKPTTRKYLEGLETFPAHNIRRGLEYLKNEETVGIFPEGQAHLMKEGILYKGAVWLSAMSEKKILPVYISKNSNKVNTVMHPALNDIYINWLPPLNPPKSTSKEDLENKIEEFNSSFENHKTLLSSRNLY